MANLSLLMLEDSPLDAELARTRLERSGLEFTVRRVDARDDFLKALGEGGFDLILADYNLPGFGGREALEIARRERPDVPFIFVSGALGEETAIESLKEGATDYVLKQRLDRLAPAVMRALAEVREKASRIEAERALHETRERNRLILESVKDYAIIGLDLDGRIASWNAGAEAVFGYAEEEALGRPLAMLSAPEAGGDPHALANWGLARQVEGERLYARRGGERFWGSGSLRPILDDDGALRGYVQVLHDMTERKRFEEALREADRRKDEFLVMLAHELRNPLAAVRGAGQLLRRSAEPESVAWAGAVVERQVKHLARLVEDLLDVSRISRGIFHLRRERLDPVDLLREAIESARPAVEGKGQALTARLPDEPLAIEADRTRFEQVVVNLVTNASKYTPAGGRIEVAAEVDGDELVVSVADDGEGIAPEMLERIFLPFVQADQGIDRAQGGLGIGLTLARDLARMHGGTLTAASDGPGHGSTFTLRLPGVAPADAPAEPAPAAPDGQAAPAPPLRILIVDDNEPAAHATAELLRLEGHDVATVHDGLSALDEARARLPEVVILDIGLPGMDGFEVAERLRSDLDGHGPLIVGVSGYGDERAIRRSRDVGFDHYLVKPIDCDALIALLGDHRPIPAPG